MANLEKRVEALEATDLELHSGFELVFIKQGEQPPAKDPADRRPRVVVEFIRPTVIDDAGQS